MEITPEKSDKKDEDGGVQRGNAPKEEFSGPPEQAEKAEEGGKSKGQEPVKTIVMPEVKAPGAKNDQKDEVKPKE